MRKIVAFIFLLSHTILFSQTGTVTGILEEENGPLPGASILVKGTQKGVQTDFDGKYSIECTVGDVLVITYVGFKAQEILVTEDMFSDVFEEPIVLIKSKPVRTILNGDYSGNLRRMPEKLIFNPQHQTTIQKKHYGSSRDLNDIARIKVKDNKIKLYHRKPSLYLYEIEYLGGTTQRFVQHNNLPKFQTIFAQGSNGIDWEGPETGTIFSFGPRLSSLGFDNSTYAYDTNGRLVPFEVSEGSPAIAYPNELFQNTYKNEHYIHFSINNENFRTFSTHFKHTTINDLFGREKAQNIIAGANYSRKGQQWSLDSSIKYGYTSDDQPNINGFQNLLLFQNYITPSSFDNTQGSVLPSGEQRSFAPGVYNNPFWLLDTNQNTASSSNSSIALDIKRHFSDNLELTLGGVYIASRNKNRFALPAATVGFLNGSSSQKNIDNTKLEGFARFTTDFDLSSDIQVYSTSHLSISNEQLDYDFNEVVGINTLSRKRTPERTNYEFINSLSFKYSDFLDTELTLGNASYTSTLQEDALWQPSIKLYTNLRDLLHDELYILYFINYWGASAGYSFSNATSPLFYGNTSHNSLEFLPENALSYTANNDLFTEASLQLEDITRYEIESDIRLLRHRISLGVNYFSEERSNAVFPVLNNNYTLANVATIENKGLEAHFGVDIIKNEKISWNTNTVFSKNRTKVTKINSSESRIPISGFSNINQNLIVGQPAGVIVGSAYQRNANGQILIDDTGYPIVHPEQQIIGDPTPDFQLGFSNNFDIGEQIKIAFTIDWRQGGDIWNGTQQVLNYFGRSQESAQQRNIQGFIFEGITTDGTTNTTPVTFLDPTQDAFSNRWTRYGFSGVGESGIVDGSYINLKNITVSYDFIKKKEGYQYKTLKSVKLIFYGNNLFTYSKYDGASPYTALFDGVSAQALQFFNTPLVSEVGFKLNLKI